MSRYVVLASGSRFMPAEHQALIYAELMKVLEDHQDDQIREFLLVQGGARGLDLLAARVGKSLGYNVKTEEADWESYGKRAGRLRNQLMLDKWHPDEALFFHHDRALGLGTADMYVRCKKAGVPTKVVIYPAP